MIGRTNIQVLIFTRNPEFKCLILKRTPERSGYWQPVSGGVKNREKVLDAVKREILEETGIEKLKKIYDLNYNFTYEEPKNGILMKMRDICFAAEINNETNIKLSKEHEKYIWCTEKKAKKI
ncbi:MAG: NUDIX domain-containing protein, partial [Promethearchaeota archaeon]